MFQNEKNFEINVGNSVLKVNTGKIARQASGSVMLEMGDTKVLVTATRSKDVRDGQDFFPLTVDYIEKMYASGKFPGGFIKREAKPSTEEILISRIVDRPIRPLFPDGFLNAVHIVINVLSFDGVNMPENMATIGASLALGISDIPFSGPVAGVTVGMIDGKYILNPTKEEQEKSRIYLSVAGTKDAITMVEASSDEVLEEEMLNAILFGHENIKNICNSQIEIINSFDVKKMEFTKTEIDAEVKSYLDEYKEDIKKAILVPGKLEKQEAVENLGKKLEEFFIQAKAREILTNKEEKDIEVAIDELLGVSDVKDIKYYKKHLRAYYHDLEKEIVRNLIIFDKYRPDGRKIDEIRPLYAEIDTLKMPHGSALFTRGETQSLATVTLGTKDDEQIIDGLEEESRKKFFLHYNFPPFSVGEAGFLRAPGRRELGHGNLAERALKAVMPSEEEFPYTVRVVSEITESNGSSSQASICGGSLALMAAGVPIRKTVAGIAMGLIKENDEYTVLTDIQGLEDHLGDMDFKVAGTKDGITAIQMDIKIEGISREIMDIALKQANKARFEIIEVMENVIKEPRKELSPTAPKIINLQIDPNTIAILIGPGGKNIKAIIDETNVQIDIEDDGRVSIYGKDQAMMNKAKELVEMATFTPELDKVYKGRVVKLAKFGAFVALAPGKEGLLHISEISDKRIKNVEDALVENQEVVVKVISMENDKFSLSMKKVGNEDDGKNE
ncbi:polyribonucleotide nucleotidyltransferase [Oceanivirga miroungae]|uniref:Polyribonucleotide nucleotidyltransferase n=1 Tax=Oceanivirga miroungae TaxID=1130046 RepID=A0A6I8MCW2_9FUSO|nr:polyribonucleotide nucleotidyltransferase [Oceanivirga miroungae]VWL85280.1 polynucleotide phosphorylase/polyadenylase [Oceanivirga miroungae]